MKYTLLVVSIVFFDQLSKILIKNYWFKKDFIQSFDYINVLGDYLRFVFIENPGIAFGINPSRPVLLIILTFSIIIILFFHLFFLVKNNSNESLPITFVLGGAIGNAIDRFLALLPSSGYKGVIDFIDIGFGDCFYCRWYVFNLADVSITIGLVLIIYQGFFAKEIIEK